MNYRLALATWIRRTVHWAPCLAALGGGIALCPAQAAELPSIREAVFFGDSLTDAGTFGFRFTTGQGRTWAQRVAERYGQSQESNEHMERYADVYKGVHGVPGPGGLNYAEGGARAAAPYSQVSQDPEGTPISVTVQLQHYLAQHGSFRADQVVFVYVGTNDVAYDYDPANNATLAAALRAGNLPADAVLREQEARVEEAADATREVVRRILHTGAQRVVVFELADLGDLPWFRTPASQKFATHLSRAFNRRLVQGLPDDPRILVIHVQDFVDSILSKRQEFGIEHGAHEDACRLPDQDVCAEDAYAVPRADQTYFFAAAEHLTTRANELLAAYVLRQVAAHPFQ